MAIPYLSLLKVSICVLWYPLFAYVADPTSVPAVCKLQVLVQLVLCDIYIAPAMLVFSLFHL